MNSIYVVSFNYKRNISLIDFLARIISSKISHKNSIKLKSVTIIHHLVLTLLKFFVLFMFKTFIFNNLIYNL